MFLSALEHYEEVFEPFQRYRMFTSELRIYRARLTTQRTIFRNNVQLLLCSIVEVEEARHMLKDVDHYLWIDGNFQESITRQLGESGISCEDTIRMIVRKLEELMDECTKFDSVVSSVTAVCKETKFTTFSSIFIFISVSKTEANIKS